MILGQIAPNAAYCMSYGIKANNEIEWGLYCLSFQPSWSRSAGQGKMMSWVVRHTFISVIDAFFFLIGRVLLARGDHTQNAVEQVLLLLSTFFPFWGVAEFLMNRRSFSWAVRIFDFLTITIQRNCSRKFQHSYIRDVVITAHVISQQLTKAIPKCQDLLC